jgi:uncharacterized protein DUF3160
VAPAPPRSDEWDALVAAVHTDVPDPIAGDPGGVLHEGVGNVNLLMMAVDNGPDRMIFAGPVLSYYEFATASVTRLTDEQWKSQVLTNLPPTPEWTPSFTVPGQATIPSYVR